MVINVVKRTIELIRAPAPKQHIKGKLLAESYNKRMSCNEIYQFQGPPANITKSPKHLNQNKRRDSPKTARRPKKLSVSSPLKCKI